MYLLFLHSERVFHHLLYLCSPPPPPPPFISSVFHTFSSHAPFPYFPAFSSGFQISFPIFSLPSPLPCLRFACWCCWSGFSGCWPRLTPLKTLQYLSSRNLCTSYPDIFTSFLSVRRNPLTHQGRILQILITPCYISEEEVDILVDIYIEREWEYSELCSVLLTHPLDTVAWQIAVQHLESRPRSVPGEGDWLDITLECFLTVGETRTSGGNSHRYKREYAHSTQKGRAHPVIEPSCEATMLTWWACHTVVAKKTPSIIKSNVKLVSLFHQVHYFHA